MAAAVDHDVGATPCVGERRRLTLTCDSDDERYRAYGAAPGVGANQDVAGTAGVECLPAGHVITRAELESCAAYEDVEIRRGDILLVRTGWLDSWQRSAPGVPGPGAEGQPGIGLNACDFIRDHDIAAVGADNSAVEAIPFDGNTFLSVHIELLVNLGVPMLEHLSLAELARDRRYECLLYVAPLAVTGAGGSPVNPIAIA